jgi:hypothetical protein
MAKGFKQFTNEEDAVILAYCKEARDEGVPQSTVYFKIADELKRPIGSVEYRAKRLAKAMTSKGAVKGISDSERLVLRLKSLSHERVRSAEKVEVYKDKFQNLDKDYKALQRRYRDLQLEHQALIDTVRKALGDDIEDYRGEVG